MTVALAPEFERLSWLVATDGLDRHELAVGAAVRAARESGADHVILDVLGDRGAPTVVRERALGRVSAAILRARPGRSMPAVA